MAECNKLISDFLTYFNKTSRDNNEISLESLPTEIFIEILKYLPKKDLLVATLVCKTFNYVISNDVKLLEDFKVKISENNLNHDCILTRKYSYIVLNHIKLDNVIPSLKMFGKYVKSLKIHCVIDFKSFREILVMCANLKDLDVIFLPNSIKIEESKIEESQLDQSMPNVKLNKFRLKFHKNFENHLNYLKLFTKIAVNEFEICSSLNIDLIQNFLISQSNLKVLTIYNENIFDNNRLNFVNFRLKKLSAYFNFSGKNEENAAKFLENHKNSLEYLEIHRISDKVAEILNKFTKLETFKACGVISSKLKASTVRKLELKFGTRVDANQFPFVENLEFFYGNVHSIQYFKFTKELMLYGTDLNELIISNVKVLKLLYVNIHGNPFKFEGSNLEELEVISSLIPPSWLIEYLNRSRTKLKRLKIIYCNLTEEIIAAIKENLAKIIQFECDKICRK